MVWKRDYIVTYVSCVKFSFWEWKERNLDPGIFPLYGNLIGLGWPVVCGMAVRGMRLKNKIHSFIFYCRHTDEYEGIALPLLCMRARGNDRLDHSCWITVSSDLSNLTHIAVQVSPLRLIHEVKYSYTTRLKNVMRCKDSRSAENRATR